jgi:TolB protein
MRYFALAMLSLLAAVGCGDNSDTDRPSDHRSRIDTTPPAAAPLLAKAGINPTIAYTAEIDGNTDIYVLRKGKPVRITRHPAADEWPAWSPDGRKIAFQSKRDGNMEIYVADADGSNQKRLTQNDGFDGYCVWSPDGSSIAFQRDSGEFGYTPKIYVMDADGGNVQVLIADPNPGQPAWSPDGRRIAFSGHEGPAFFTEDDLPIKEFGTEIYVVNVNGSNLTRLTRDHFENMFPTWSPDGKKIAFVSNRGGTPGDVGVLQIFTMNADGSDIKQMTKLQGQSQRPTWSPDGQWIAFYFAAIRPVNESPDTNIFAVNMRNLKLFKIMSSENDEYSPAWRPINDSYFSAWRPK